MQIELSEQSIKLLTRLSKFGIYGVTPEEVAARFVDAALQKMVEQSPRLISIKPLHRSTTPKSAR